MNIDLAQYNESKYQLLYENSLDGILLVTPDGKLLSANPAAQKMFGRTEAELQKVGREGIINEACPFYQEAFKIFIETGAFEGELNFNRKTGEVFPGALSIRMFHDQHGEPLAVLTIRDISNKKRNEQSIRDYAARIERMVLGTVDAISHMGELRDPYTAGHQHRVASIAVDIASEMGLSSDFQIGLRIAGALHDVGKIAIPTEILTMPRRLTELEFSMVKSHTTRGYEILSTIDSPWPIADVALQHHERLDGSGYPHGLKGEEILLESRIVSVADVTEAMTSHRPYRAGLGIDAALAEIEQGAGKIYDADAAAACLRLFREKAYQFPSAF